MCIVQGRLAAWVLGVLLVAAPAFAAPPTGSRGTHSKTPIGGSTGSTGATGVGSSGNTTTQTDPKAQTETALSLLRDARHLVSGAHFSYDGHRALAMKEIDRAVRELSPPKTDPTQTNTQTPHATSTQHTTNHRGTAGQASQQGQQPPQQTQAQADAKLREAITLLTRAQKRITNNPNVSDDIAAAIAELQAALQQKQ
jgi:hypothetical protein